jgi:2-polyprenyl-3-methyl-5-hydroxy-6-metoxy-1,4-benzoquinol methylase
MSNNYLEHVQFPAAFFNECGGLIAPKGKMAHSTPCFDYVYEFSAFHLYFYCGESIRKLAERTGFRVLSEHRIDKEYADSSYACFVFEKLD